MQTIDIPSRLRQLRADNNFTCQYVAAKIGKAIAVYQNYEAGRSNPSIQTLLALGELYSIETINELIGLEKSKKTATIIIKYRSITPEKRKIVDFILAGE